MSGLMGSRVARVCALLAGAAGVLGGFCCGRGARAVEADREGLALDVDCHDSGASVDPGAEEVRGDIETALGTISDCAARGAACSSVHGAAACLRGSCSTLCYAGWGDCDGDATNGCETALTGPDNCGACGATCELANANETCASGACRVSSCDAAWCDANRDASDGCEYNLNRNAHCGEYTYLGRVRGDEGNDAIIHADIGERRYRVYVAEASSGGGCHDLGVRIRLTPAVGTDYDLYAYCTSCGSAEVHSTNTGSAMEEVTMRWGEDCLWGLATGSDSGRSIYVWVVYRNANTCGEYTLSVSGNVISGANTCPPK